MQRRCGVYVRSATGDKEAMAAQQAAGIALCRKNRWQFEVFRESGTPGSVLRKLVELVKAGKINRVFVNTVDRLTRNISQWLAVYEEIERHGAKIVTPDGCIADTAIHETLVAFQRFEQSFRAKKRRALVRGESRR